MRLTVDDLKDPEKAALCQRAKIFLDGKEVTRCTIADEEQGYIERYVDPDDPRYSSAWTEWPRETLHGQVKIVDPENP